MPNLRMVPLATTRSGFEAKVLAARLGAEGIVWEFRGNVDGVYPLGDVEVLVSEADLERAGEVLEDGVLIDDEFESLDADDGTEQHSRAEWWVGLGLVLVVVTFLVMRLLAMT